MHQGGGIADGAAGGGNLHGIVGIAGNGQTRARAREAGASAARRSRGVRSGRLNSKVGILKARHDEVDRYGDRESGEEGGGGDSREDTDVLIVRVQ